MVIDGCSTLCGHPALSGYHETWWFSVIDVVQVLTQQADDLTARKYWNQLKRRLDKEGSQLVTICHQLKMPTADGKQRLTDVATAETLLRLVQSVPSPKAEPIKLWLAKVGYERMQEMADPALTLDRARQTWQQHGRSDASCARSRASSICSADTGLSPAPLSCPLLLRRTQLSNVCSVCPAPWKSLRPLVRL
jgi:hypothetical protein